MQVGEIKDSQRRIRKIPMKEDSEEGGGSSDHGGREERKERRAWQVWKGRRMARRKEGRAAPHWCL